MALPVRRTAAGARRCGGLEEAGFGQDIGGIAMRRLASTPDPALSRSCVASFGSPTSGETPWTALSKYTSGELSGSAVEHFENTLNTSSTLWPEMVFFLRTRPSSSGDICRPRSFFILHCGNHMFYVLYMRGWEFRDLLVFEVGN